MHQPAPLRKRMVNTWLTATRHAFCIARQDFSWSSKAVKALFVLVVLFGGNQYILEDKMSLQDCGISIANGVESLTLDDKTVAVPDDAAYVCRPDSGDEPADWQ